MEMPGNKTELLLYMQIDALLKDICSFLSDEIYNGFASNENKEETARQLITRSKSQLIAISERLSTITDVIPGYIDMQGPPVVSEYVPADKHEDDESGVYANPNLIGEVNHEEQRVCPYETFSASDVPNYGKAGYLYRKERSFFFEQQRKVFVVVEKNWLLVYHSKKHSKPYEIFDLHRYEAKLVTAEPKHCKRMEKSFRLTTVPTSKEYHFVAVTHEDMIDWVTVINACDKLSFALASPSIVTDETDDQIYDVVRPTNDFENPQLLHDKLNREYSLRPLPKIPSPAHIQADLLVVKTETCESFETYEEPSLPSNWKPKEQKELQVNGTGDDATYDLLCVKELYKSEHASKETRSKNLVLIPNKSKLFDLVRRKRCI